MILHLKDEDVSYLLNLLDMDLKHCQTEAENKNGLEAEKLQTGLWRLRAERDERLLRYFDR